MQPIWMTIVFPVREGKVLLAKKTRKIGVGKWNGWGGKVESGETIRGAAVRELQKESGLTAEEAHLEKVAICTFVNTTEAGEEFLVKCVVFLLMQWEGEVCVNEEMKDPTWFPIGELPPNEDFMAADPYWVPLLLSGKKLNVLAKYSSTWECLGEPIVQVVPKI